MFKRLIQMCEENADKEFKTKEEVVADAVSVLKPYITEENSEIENIFRAFIGCMQYISLETKECIQPTDECAEFIQDVFEGVGIILHYPKIKDLYAIDFIVQIGDEWWNAVTMVDGIIRVAPVINSGIGRNDALINYSEEIVGIYGGSVKYANVDEDFTYYTLGIGEEADWKGYKMITIDTENNPTYVEFVFREIGNEE